MSDADTSISIEPSQEEMELDEDIEDYLNIALANGFSKGTANVSPRDMVKLRGLLKHYAKKKHPFTACYRDQVKHGLSPDHAKKRCAVIKDLIKGTTKWRSTERKKNLSEEELNEFILNEAYGYSDNDIVEFVDYAINLTDETVNIILTSNNEDNDLSEIELNAGDVAWTPGGSFNDIRRQIEAELNDGSDPYSGSSFWVEDIRQSEALVCSGGKDYYVVPFSVSKKGNVELDDEDSWKFVERAWVESNMSLSDDQVMAELFFTDAGDEKADKDGLIWKTFLREGIWAYSPGSGKVLPKPLTIVKTGKSDSKKLIVSMADIKKNFDSGTIQHVTVPLNHDDKVNENSGFVRKLRYGKDEKGRTTLEAAIDFTEPDIKEKVERGTIPNVSGGIHLNYINKESGKKFDAVLGHLALTPKPWIQGMKPFGVKASENLNVLSFSEVNDESTDNNLEGGAEEIMSTVETENADTFLSEIGLSEDEVKARLARYEELERENKQNKIDQKIKEWEDAKKSPAVIKEAKAALLADEGLSTITLSEEGKNVELSLSDLVDRLVSASPEVNLADDPITDRETSVDEPNDTEEDEELSDEIKNEANRLWLYENYSEEDAVVEAKKRLSAKEE